MGFNVNSFNRTPFNYSGDNTVWGKATGFEEINCSIGTGLNFNGRAIGYEKVEKSIVGNPAWLETVIGIETIEEAVLEADAVAFAIANGIETVEADTYLSADILATIVGTEIATANVTLGVEISISAEGAEVVDTDTVLGANIRSPLVSGYEFIDESASLESIDIKTCYLNVTLKPGQVLIIDANTYNVLLDNENAIDIHSGDWIDELNRNTVDLKIEAASGSANLEATILYTERFL